MNGKKDVLGMYVGENESAKFWLSIMNGLKNRGVEDILLIIAGMDMILMHYMMMGKHLISIKR